MIARIARHALAQAVLVAMILSGGPLQAQATDDLEALGEQIQTLTNSGKYAEAIEVAKQSVALAEKDFGTDDIRTAHELYRLGNMMRRQAQYPAAHPFLLRALAIFERQTDGRQDLDIAHTLNELGWTSLYTLHLQEAQQFFSRSLAAKEKLVEPDHIEMAYTLDGLAMTNVYASQFEAAARYAARSLAIKKKRLAPDDNDIADSIVMLATIKFKNGQMAEAGKLFQEVLDVERAKSAPDALRIADLVGLVAIVSFDKGDYETAERQARESIDLLEHNGGTERGTYFSCYNLMAKILAFTNRYAEAERSAKKVIQAYGTSPVVQPRDVMDATNTLAVILMGLDRYAEAEQALKKALAIAEETFGETGIDVAKALENLAYIYATVGRSTEALDLFKRILRIRNDVLPAGHPEIGSTYANRSRVLNTLKRYQEAEADAREGIRILEANYGEKHPMALSTRDELGTALKGQGRYADALQVYEDAMRVTIAAEGEKSSRIPTYLHNMGLVLELAGRNSEAEDAYLRSIATKEAGTLSEAQTREVLAALYVKMSRYREARENFRVALAVFVEAFNKTAANRTEYEGGIWLKLTASTYLSALLASTDYTPAERQAVGKEAFEVAQWLLRTTTSSTMTQLGARYAAATGQLAQSVRERQDSLQRWQAMSAQLDRLISQPIGDRNQTQVTAVRSELTKLEAGLTELDQLLAKQFPAYMELSSPRPVTVDEVQTLLRSDEALVQFVVLDQRVVAWVVTPRDVAWYPLSVRVADLANSVAALRCGLDYEGAWAVAGSRCPQLLNTTYTPEDRQTGRPLPFDAARAHALYMALFGEAAALIKDKHLLVVLSGPLTQLPLQVLIDALPVDGPSGERTREVALLGAELRDLSPEARQQAQLPDKAGVTITKPVAGGPAELAGLKVNDILLSIGEDSVFGTQHTIGVVRAQTPGATVRATVLRGRARIDLDITLGATTLREWQPLFLEAKTVREVAWLTRTHAITVLPAVSSLKALRQLAKESHASEPYIGFGNPLLDGEPEKFSEDGPAAKLAREKRCDRTLGQRVASLFSLRGGTRAITRSTRGVADVAVIRSLAPLPDTADELCDVAQDLGVNPNTHLYLGPMATETEIKRLSDDGALAKYRIIHFATHGAVSGEISGTAEPGLVLTPPNDASDVDDGYLTASEVAELKLDADLVILSACNTMAGNTKGAEALSGLARAFFYAGARSLLVSHWEVDSQATVKLITKAVDALKANPKIGRAEALRRSMLAMINNAKGLEAYPAFWAPFALVGEGAAAQ